MCKEAAYAVARDQGQVGIVYTTSESMLRKM